jgi:hypothetical protein
MFAPYWASSALRALAWLLCVLHAHQPPEIRARHACGDVPGRLRARCRQVDGDLLLAASSDLVPEARQRAMPDRLMRLIEAADNEG